MNRSENPKNLPAYRVFTIEEKTHGESEDAESHWHAIGVGWDHKDTKGISVKLNALPLTNKITLRRIEDEKETVDVAPTLSQDQS